MTLVIENDSRMLRLTSAVQVSAQTVIAMATGLSIREARIDPDGVGQCVINNPDEFHRTIPFEASAIQTAMAGKLGPCFSG